MKRKTGRSRQLSDSIRERWSFDRPRLYTIHTYSRNGSKRRRKNDRYQWDNKNKYIDAQGEKQGVSEKPKGFEGKERVLSLEIPGHYVIYPPSPLSLSSELTRQEGKLMKGGTPVSKKK